MLENIKVGKTSKKFETVSVGMIFDHFDHKTHMDGTTLQHFRLIEADGLFIVSVESFYLNGPPKIEYKGFLTIEDAREYLEMHGITNENKEEQKREDNDHF